MYIQQRMPAQMFSRPRRFKRRPRSRKPFNSNQVKAIKKLAVATQDMKIKSSSLSTNDLVISTSYYLSIDALAIAKGTASDERIADRIDVKDITYRTSLGLESPFTTFGNYNVRVLIVQFPEGKTTAVNSLFNSLSAEDYLPTLEETDGVKYKVLHDKNIVVAPFSPRRLLVHRVKASDLMVKSPEYESASTTMLRGDVVYYLNSDNIVGVTGSFIEASTTQRLRYFG